LEQGPAIEIAAGGVHRKMQPEQKRERCQERMALPVGGTRTWGAAPHAAVTPLGRQRSLTSGRCLRLDAAGCG
jgi:hypothetical protein